MKFIKHLIKTWLRSRNYFVSYANPSGLTGFDLEEDLKRIISTKEPVIFDVGANVGQTIDTIRQAFPQPKILAFEPSPRVFSGLQASHAGPDLKLFQLALGSQKGFTTFHEYERSVLSSALEITGAGENPFKDVKKIASVDVEVGTVDGIMSQEKLLRIDLLKIDTQGFDLEVLKGAEKAFASGVVGHVLVELNFTALYDGQASAGDVHSFLVQRGFALVDYYDKYRLDAALSWCSALYQHV